MSVFGCVAYIQPKYILQLKKVAEQRKREQEIVFERKQKKEIDSEKEKYGEKDAFVTPSYRKVLEEREAEEERLRREEEREGRHCGGLKACNCAGSSELIMHFHYCLFTASVKNKDLSLFYRNLLDRRVSGGNEGEGKETKDRTAVRQSPQQSSTVEVAKDVGSSRPERHIYGGSSSQEDSKSRRSSIPVDGGTLRKSSSSSSSDADRHGRVQSSELHASPEQPQRPKSPSPTELTKEETPTAGDTDAKAEVNESKSLSKEDKKLAAEIVRKRRAEQRNDEDTVSAARERYLARKKAKQTAS